ncbi:M20/M25/M40 family metallo-hydrolase [Leuconostoc lactis]|uniref:M20/M25/M40 family metallo-hydrolase n=1 Tax=Leuconostoc lactis TaxID=1246 RepID=UPI0021A27270|nr:M20/M25/M40 family metallo-hydrolase [Leuconostoc lactis]MCT3115508.1 M20/M25/M40 family metallo-hydrolase [Leuconostoc lactis]
MTIRQDYLTLLEELVAIPSVSAQAASLPEAATTIANAFRQLGAKVTYDDTYFAPFVLAEFTSDQPDAKTLVIYNHYDVQPAEPLDLWTTAPWTLSSRDGKLYGRGVDDDKGNLTARLAAVAEYLKENDQTLPVNIIFIVEGAEETASQYLPEYLAKHASTIKADLVLWESGGKNADEIVEIYGGNKGIVTFELTANTADNDLHSSLSAVVDSAPIRLSQAIAALFDQQGNIAVPHFYDEVIAPNAREKALIGQLPLTREDLVAQHGLKVPLYTDRNGQDLKETLYFQPTLNVQGIISGYNDKGVKTVLPATATAKLEARLVPNMSPDITLQRIADHLTAQGFADITVTKTLGLAGYRSDMSDPEIQRVISVAKAYYQVDPVVMPTSPSTGPMATIYAALQAPIASLGVGYANNLDHAPNEHIRLVDYDQHIDAVKALIKSYQASQLKE